MQQIINNGTVAGDGTGEILFSAFEKTNDNFTELYADKLDNVIYINDASDFPDAVGGVRELVPFSGAFIKYVIAPNTMDVGTDRFTITDGNVIIEGSHRTGSKIQNNSSTLFTCVDSFFFLNEIRVETDDEFISYNNNPLNGIKSFVTNNLIIDSCADLGTISGAFTTSFRIMTVIDVVGGSGFVWTGSDNSQINISNMLAINWDNTLLNLGNATFDIINISGGNRFQSPTGTTILSGLANNGNLNVGGRGIVENNLFNGTGTAISGISTDDLQWTFESNVFADNTTDNTRVVSDTFALTNNTVNIGVAGTYYAIGGVNWTSDIERRFTTTTAGVMTYIGLETVPIIANGSATVEKVGGGSDLLCMKIAINGTVQNKTIGCTDNTTPAQITSRGIFVINTGDTIELMVANDTGTSNIDVNNASLLVSLL